MTGLDDPRQGHRSQAHEGRCPPAKEDFGSRPYRATKESPRNNTSHASKGKISKGGISPGLSQQCICTGQRSGPKLMVTVTKAVRTLVPHGLNMSQLCSAQRRAQSASPEHLLQAFGRGTQPGPRQRASGAPKPASDETRGSLGAQGSACGTWCKSPQPGIGASTTVATTAKRQLSTLRRGPPEMPKHAAKDLVTGACALLLLP